MMQYTNSEILWEEDTRRQRKNLGKILKQITEKQVEKNGNGFNWPTVV